LYNSADVNREIGHMDVALRQFADGLQLARQSHDDRNIANSLLGIGTVYDQLGDSDRALDFYRQSLSLLSVESDVTGRVLALRRAAGVLRSRGQLQEALSMHDEALSLATTAVERASIQIQRARDLEALGQNQHSALQVLDSVTQERNLIPKVVQARVLLERAKVYISTGEWSAAELDLQSAIATFAAEEFPADAFNAWVAPAQAQHKRGSTLQALDSLGHALIRLRRSWRRAALRGIASLSR
jgi:tetratricopeptide (TPR) repeat protein